MRAIMAVSINNIIGVNDLIPWHYPEDFKFFKEKTLDKDIVVGHSTFKKLPPLPRRKTHILTRDPTTAYDRYMSLGDNQFDKLMKYNISFISDKNDCPSDAWIIGGSQVYKHFADETTEIYVSRIPEMVKFLNSDDVVFCPDEIFENFYLDDIIKKKTFNVELWKRI